MRILRVINNDIKFQYKYGFYLLYAVITIIYIGCTLAVPTSLRGRIVAIVVFSDPAALGLFFMGAIVLFEKSERVLNSLFISPLKIDEYIFSKVVSLSIISTVVGCIIAILTIPERINITSLTLGVMLGSILFSLTGLIVATRVSSLNQFMLELIPLGVVLSIPAFLVLLGFNNILLYIHPGVIILELILEGVGMNKVRDLYILMLIGWIAVFWLWARVNVRRMRISLGGVKL